MHIGHLPENFADFITKKKAFFLALLSEGLDVHLISKVIHYMTLPACASQEPFFEDALLDAPSMEEFREADTEETRHIWSAVQYLTELLNNPIIAEDEREWLEAILERINGEYGVEFPVGATLSDLIKSQENMESIEDYAVFPDGGVGWYIDKDTGMERRCRGKLVWMLHNYIREYTDSLNDKSFIGQEVKYGEGDIFELVAEIMNLRWHGKYDYANVKALYEDYDRANHGTS